MKPKVSVITSYFKGEKYLPTFIENLKSQTIFDSLELCFNHNEPTQNELEMVKTIPDKNINHQIENEVIPLYKSWNKCIESASAEYLCIWNVDDVRTLDSIELMSNYLDEHPEVDFVFGNFIIVNRHGSTNGFYVNETWSNEKPSGLTKGMNLGPFFMFRKDVVKKCGMLDEQFKSGGDFDFAVRLAANFKGHCLENILGFFLDESSGLSTRKDGVQELERDIIEYRYGITKNLNLEDPRLSNYDLETIQVDDKYYKVSDYIENYEKFVSENERV